MSKRHGIIVAMTRDRVIGRDGTTPWHYSADLKRFKRLTSHSTIIMGRKTWDSLPKKPLPQRQNIVISRSKLSEVEHYSSIPDAIAAARYDSVWCIGGASIYEQTVDECHLLDITYVPEKIDPAGCVLFPEVNWSRWDAGPERPLAEDKRLVNQIFNIRTL